LVPRFSPPYRWRFSVGDSSAVQATNSTPFIWIEVNDVAILAPHELILDQTGDEENLLAASIGILQISRATSSEAAHSLHGNLLMLLKYCGP
jgi:hypothetical protein